MSIAKNLAPRLVKSALSIALGSVLVSGCAIQNMVEADKEVRGNLSEAETHLQEIQTRPELMKSRRPLSKMNGIWVDTTPVPISKESMGAPVTALDCNITFNPKKATTLLEMGRVVTSLCGVPVKITQDAFLFMNGMIGSGVPGQAGTAGGAAAATGAAGGAMGGAANGIAAGALPPPTLGGADTNAALVAASSNSLFGSGRRDLLNGLSWIDKPLSGLLDLAAAQLGLGWKFEGNEVTFYYTDTQIFQLYAVPGKTKMAATVKSGAESSSGGSGESSGSFSADGSSQETSMEFETDILADIKATLETMITPNVGRVSVSTSTGTVTVTDRPDVLRRVKLYLDSENKRITRQVVLNVKVLSVQVNNADSAGLNWNAVYEKVNAAMGISTSFASGTTSGFMGNMGVIGGSSRWDGSQLFIDALSSQGKVSTLSSPSVTTLNLKPAPILVGTQKTYLAEVSTSLVGGATGAGGTTQQALVPGTISTGFNMTLVPYLMEGPEMLLEYSMNLSSLMGMETAESGGQMIQMPEVDNRIFRQSVKLRSGETLVLTGFDQTSTNNASEGVGDPNFWLLGGKGNQSKRRDVVVVLITPVVTN